MSIEQASKPAPQAAASPATAIAVPGAAGLVPGAAGLVPGAAGLVPGAEGGGARPSVISLAIKEKAALYAAYMPFIKGGGLFVPTTRLAKLGDEIYALVSLLEDPTRLPIPGKVIWITPTGSPGRGQGIGIQFSSNEAGEQARARIENLIGGALKAARPTHTL